MKNFLSVLWRCPFYRLFLLDFSLHRSIRSKDNCPSYRAVRFMPCPSWIDSAVWQCLSVHKNKLRTIVANEISKCNTNIVCALNKQQKMMFIRTSLFWTVYIVFVQRHTNTYWNIWPEVQERPLEPQQKQHRTYYRSWLATVNIIDWWNKSIKHVSHAAKSVDQESMAIIRRRACFIIRENNAFY